MLSDGKVVSVVHLTLNTLPPFRPATTYTILGYVRLLRRPFSSVRNDIVLVRTWSIVQTSMKERLHSCCQFPLIWGIILIILSAITRSLPAGLPLNAPSLPHSQLPLPTVPPGSQCAGNTKRWRHPGYMVGLKLISPTLGSSHTAIPHGRHCLKNSNRLISFGCESIYLPAVFALSYGIGWRGMQLNGKVGTAAPCWNASTIKPISWLRMHSLWG